MACPKKNNWCEGLLLDIDFSGLAERVEKQYYGPTETHKYNEEQDPEEGYIVRGIGPVYHKVDNPERDRY